MEDEEGFSVNLRISNGTEQTLTHLKPSLLVRDLQEKIASISGIPIEEQNLHRGPIPLSNPDATLQDAGILNSNTTLVLGDKRNREEFSMFFITFTGRYHRLENLTEETTYEELMSLVAEQAGISVDYVRRLVLPWARGREGLREGESIGDLGIGDYDGKPMILLTRMGLRGG